MEKRKQPLEPRILGFIQEHCLIPNRSHLLVAVSGGPDSACLLHVLVKLKEELAIKLHAAHLNHQLRGAESESDARYVSDLARSLNVPVTIAERDVKAYQAQKRISLEEAAREVRYDFLTQTAKVVGASQVAVGHTRDDHIETILMHLIRGSGTRGLQGLSPYVKLPTAEAVTIVRPLLEVGRELIPRFDSSNRSLSPLRNRIRLRLLPLLKSYNPRVTEALLRTAHIAADDVAFLEKEGGRLWHQIAQRQENTIILYKEPFLELPPALKRQVLRISLDKLIGNLKDIEARHIEEIMNALSKPAGRSLNLPGGLNFTIEYDRYLIGRNPLALSPLPPLGAELALTIPGRTRLGGWHVEATIKDREDMLEESNSFTSYLDLGETGDKLAVRSRRPSDRFCPLGMSQPKKLGEFMIDAKIPRLWRKRVPIVCSPQQIIWVVGWRIDDRVKVSQHTKRVLCLKFKQC
ncbi:tRNA lysidine(34) synthetase TilS [Chloroflexota bacterium]